MRVFVIGMNYEQSMLALSCVHWTNRRARRVRQLRFSEQSRAGVCPSQGEARTRVWPVGGWPYAVPGAAASKWWAALEQWRSGGRATRYKQYQKKFGAMKREPSCAPRTSGTNAN